MSACNSAVVRDRLAELTPIGSVRLTGGAFRSPLWREVMAAVLDCPVHVAGTADHVALGAAALGLFAIGHAPDLPAAVTQLDPEGPRGEPVAVDPALAAAYRGLRTAARAHHVGSPGEILDEWRRPAHRPAGRRDARVTGTADAGTGLSAPARP